MRAEDVKRWLRGREKEDEDPVAHKGADVKWDLFVELIQGIWEEGDIPERLSHIIVVLIPKGSGGFRGISLCEPIWKVVEIIVDRRLQVIDFHDALHGSVHRRGTSTAIIEAKLAQQYFHREQTPLYGIFIDLRKTFDALDRDRCLEILEKYGVGNNILRLIKTFWDQAVMVCRASGYYGDPFKAYRGTTQGGPVSPRIFNIMVDAVVREWLRQVLEDGEEVSETDVKKLLILFYIDDGYMASPDREFLQKSMDTLVDIF